jgi:uncharacterized membrane protein
MLFALLKLLHVLGVIVWIGGMVFAHFFLRPAALQLDPPLRQRLMLEALRRFFQAVLVVVVLLLVTGIWMIANAAKASVQAGIGFAMPLDWTLMATLGLVMMAIFGHIRFVLFKRLQQAVAASLWPAGGAALAAIRTWVGVNLAIGVVIVVITLLMV